MTGLGGGLGGRCPNTVTPAQAETHSAPRNPEHRHPSESWDPSPHRASVRSPRVRPVMQISNAMLVDEIRHALQTRPDRLVRGGVAKADMLAIALHAGTEMNIGQHGHTGLVE